MMRRLTAPTAGLLGCWAAGLLGLTAFGGTAWGAPSLAPSL